MTEPMVIVHREQPNRVLLVLAGIILAAVVIGVGTIGVVALHNSSRLNAREKQDTGDVRGAAYRICARGNLTRAELHVAYQQPVPLIPVGAIAKEPLFVAVLKGGAKARELGLKRVQRLNPILRCTPNLQGQAAEPLPKAAQEAYVRKYKALLLNPLPSVPSR